MAAQVRGALGLGTGMPGDKVVRGTCAMCWVAGVRASIKVRGGNGAAGGEPAWAKSMALVRVR